MSRRKPLCAWCGQPLRASGGQCTMIEQQPAQPGRPSFGWHMMPVKTSCYDHDTESRFVGKTYDHRTEQSVAAMLAMIEKRGPGRVVRNKVKP